jgi:uncharacterized DUF497 family protein
MTRPLRIEFPGALYHVTSSVSGWYLLIAALGQKLWSAFFTYRKGRIRLISVRRSRKEERVYYESEDSRKDVR